MKKFTICDNQTRAQAFETNKQRLYISSPKFYRTNETKDLILKNLRMRLFNACIFVSDAFKRGDYSRHAIFQDNRLFNEIRYHLKLSRYYRNMKGGYVKFINLNCLVLGYKFLHNNVGSFFCQETMIHRTYYCESDLCQLLVVRVVVDTFWNIICEKSYSCRILVTRNLI